MFTENGLRIPNKTSQRSHFFQLVHFERLWPGLSLATAAGLLAFGGRSRLSEQPHQQYVPRNEVQQLVALKKVGKTNWKQNVDDFWTKLNPAKTTFHHVLFNSCCFCYTAGFVEHELSCPVKAKKLKKEVQKLNNKKCKASWTCWNTFCSKKLWMGTLNL